MIEAANAATPTRIIITAPALAAFGDANPSLKAQIDCNPWVRVCDLIDVMFHHPDRIHILSLRVV